ncbi:phenylalanine--tRNA ligase subunit beta [Methanotorris formicicus]|uniref:Phenylalanine--tRNA ligase beta subunit n=1 Tax=Methanotorris formicicus Mc-S-70 TaxID=647171 RepID=H1KWE4_9EURY|nr:phenylalanine--tRNA ligase subunit beta [Methanotorris formicicus]EHP89521.1 phenylalanyl-tRNA synthetase, beta subunit [Methanotorris formicicus Mc-S-70]
MPTINVKKSDLERLVNMDLSDAFIEEKFPMMGVEVEEIFKEDCEKVVQFSINPNRPDYLSVEGLARGFRGFIGIETGLKRYDVYESDIKIYVEDVKTRPYIAFALVKNVQIDDAVLESIINLQEKLHWTIGRDRKKVAIGIHDADKVESPFYYKEVDEDGIKFIPLNAEEEMTPKEILEKHEKGIKYAHLINDRFPIILDKNGNVLSMPPIINGILTKVTTETRNLLIDVTGTDKNAVENTLNIIVTALADRGGTIFKTEVIYKDEKITYPNLEPKIKETTPEFINKTLGLNLNVGEIVSCLRKGRMDSIYENGRLKIFIPPYRVDILHEVDFAEEVAINYGYDKFTGEYPIIGTIGEVNKLEKKCDFIREIMIGLDFYEVVNLTLSNQKILFENMRLDVDEKDYIEVLKPASVEHRVVRTSILPLLLETLRINKHKELPQRIFEIGDCVVIDENFETRGRTIKKIAGVVIHPTANFNEIKSYVEALLRELKINYELESYKHPSFIDGRCAKIISNGKGIGCFGEIHPEVILNFDLEHPIVGFEIEIE